jgi:protein PhnA
MTISYELATLRARANGVCELCSSVGSGLPYAVAPFDDGTAAHSVLICEGCYAQLDGKAQLESNRWFSLQQAIWSEHAPVQVLSHRIATRLRHESWARDLLDQVYLDSELLAWAQSGSEATSAESSAETQTVDSYGTKLIEGDSVTLIKDLDVKGAGFVAKRGTLVKAIHLTDNPEQVEGRVNGSVIVLKTGFLKKA